jgi:WD40 repeat protein
MDQLNGRQLQQLREVLLSAFPQPHSLREMVKFNLDQDLDAVAGGGDYTSVIYNLITWAAARGKLRELVDASPTYNPGNQQMPAFIHQVNTSIQSLGSNTDLSDLGKAKRYRTLLQALRNGDWRTATDLFGGLENYRDVPKVIEALNQVKVAVIDAYIKGDFVKVIETIRGLGAHYPVEWAEFLTETWHEVQLHMEEFTTQSTFIWCVAFLDENQILIGTQSNTIEHWDLMMKKNLKTLKLVDAKAPVRGLTLLPGSQQAVSSAGEYDGRLTLWDIETGKDIFIWKGHQSAVLAVAVLPEKLQILSGARSGTIRLWNQNSAKSVREFIGHQDAVRCLAVLPDGCHFVSGSADGTLKLWQPDSGKAIRDFIDHDGVVYSVAVTPDGQQILSGSQDRTLKLWDIGSGQVIRTFTGHQRAVRSVILTPDSRHILSGAEDGSVRLWNLNSGQELLTLRTRGKGAYAVAISKDGSRIVSGGDQGILYSWSVPKGLLNPLSQHPIIAELENGLFSTKV